MLRIAILSMLLLVAFPHGAGADDVNQDLLTAARKGDAAAVKSLLAKGADVNTRSPYGATPLSFAADKGHLTVVRVLLDHKADVNARDNFYHWTPLTWAAMNNHPDVARALIEAGAAGADEVLLMAAAEGKTDMVRAVLATGKLQEPALTKALAATPDEHTAVVGLLRKAGAKATAPAAEVAVDPALLAAYAGTYRGDELTLTVTTGGGKLRAQFNDFPVMQLRALDQSAFTWDGTGTLTFRRTADKVTGVTMKYGTQTMQFVPVEAAKSAPAKKAAVLSPDGVVTTPKNWPSFRGPNATGVADGQFPPVTWDAEKGHNVRWKTPIPGLGLSSPVVWGDHVYLTTAVSAGGKAGLKTGQYGDVGSAKDDGEHTWKVYCVDKTSGKVVWERTACKGVPKVKRHTKSSHANPTPATDGVHVVVSFGSEGLYCYSRAGDLLWEKNFGVLDSGWFYDADYQWGFASSPVIYQGLVIVQCDVGKGSFVAAFRVADGKEVWRQLRDEVPSWGTPTVIEGPDRAEMVTGGTKFARGYDPLTGKELWRLGGHGEITVPTPFYGAGLIFVSNGYQKKPIYAIRPGATGDITLKKGEKANAAVAWSSARGGPYMPTPIVYGGHLYVCSDGGVLTCYEAKTGKQVYRERLGGRDGYTASAVAADGRLYFTAEDGTVSVVRAGPHFELLAENRLDDSCLATPAISDGMIFIRTERYLFGIGGKTIAR
jgi:outer membrane protein assembly factor BamB